MGFVQTTRLTSRQSRALRRHDLETGLPTCDVGVAPCNRHVPGFVGRVDAPHDHGALRVCGADHMETKTTVCHVDEAPQNSDVTGTAGRVDAPDDHGVLGVGDIDHLKARIPVCEVGVAATVGPFPAL